MLSNAERHFVITGKRRDGSDVSENYAKILIRNIRAGIAQASQDVDLLRSNSLFKSQTNSLFPIDKLAAEAGWEKGRYQQMMEEHLLRKRKITAEEAAAPIIEITDEIFNLFGKPKKEIPEEEKIHEAVDDPEEEAPEEEVPEK